MATAPGAARHDDGPPATGPDALPAELAIAFASGGELGARLRDLDWSTTGMPEPARWPAPTRHAVARMLGSRAQIISFWGSEMTALYNDAYAPAMGEKHPRFLGRPARELWHETWDVLGPLLDGVVSSRSSFWATDHRFLLERHGYLEETYFDVSYDPVLLEDGSVGGVFCIVTETTGRVRGERRVRTLSALGSRLAGRVDERALAAEATAALRENAPDVPFALLYLDGDGEHLSLAGAALPPGCAPVTGSAAALLDLVAGGQTGEIPAAEAVTGPTGAAPTALVLPVSSATQTVGALVVGVSPLLALDTPYRDFLELAAAQISRAVGTLRAYEEERRRAAALAALDRAKTNFFSNISHEFRTPLTLILGPLEDALAGPVPTPYRESLELMHRNALRLLKLVNTVLDFSRLESGRIRARYAPTDLSDYTARLASVFRSAVDRAGLLLVVDCAPLPRPVHVDRDMWEKIVLNLLSNALKFTFEGQIAVKVSDGGEAAVLRVSDTGVGVPAAELPHLFTRFHRVVGARSRSHEGTGIGLALVQELTDLHGGSIAVDSTENAGTVFEVHIPYGTAHLPADRVAADAPAAAPGSARLYVAEALRWDGEDPGRDGFAPLWTDPDAAFDDRATAAGRGRILLVDDNADLRDYVGRLLSPRWSVVAVADGRAALDAALRGGFDLVLTDVMMPGLDGFGLVRRLRADPRTRDVPVVLLSARAGADASVEGLAAGADDYLVKPFTAQELVARVRANLELGQQRNRIVQQLRQLTDAAVALYGAASTRDVVRVAAEQARALVGGGRAAVEADGYRAEVGVAPPTGPDPAITIPLLLTSGVPLGTIRVWPAGKGAMTAGDRAVLTPLARLVALRTENARLYEAEHRVANTLQHSLLPRSLPAVPGATVASRYLPGNSEADVGGDWYDVLMAPDGLVFLVIGDVVGKGVQAAAAMGQLRNGLRAYMLEGFDPGSALARLNRLVGTLGAHQFATLVCVCYDPRSGRITFSSAGHPPPVLYRPDTGARFLHEGALGPPVGAIAGAEYPTMEAHLAPGSRLLLYTDGLIEDRRSSLDAGLRGLLSTVEAPADHIEDLLDRLLARAADRPRRDDIALLALETTEARRFALNLPADPTRLTVLRRRMEAFLTAQQVPEEDIFDLTVAVSEAAANAIEHPVGPTVAEISVDLTVEDDAVVATVRNTGRWQDTPSDRHRGRGLALIRTLAELSVTSDASGTAVTMRRPLTHP